jgi:SsrA-binding protein
MYFRDGRAKVEIALARGKDQFDKRESIKERESKRDMQRELREVNRR